MSSDDAAVILGHFDDKFSALIENIDTLMDIKLQPLIEDMAEVKTDIKTIKLAVKETNNDLKLLERRVTKLENA